MAETQLELWSLDGRVPSRLRVSARETAGMALLTLEKHAMIRTPTTVTAEAAYVQSSLLGLAMGLLQSAKNVATA